MAVGLSEAIRDLMLQWFGNIVASPPRPVDTWWLQWHTNDPGIDGDANVSTMLPNRDALAGSNPWWALEAVLNDGEMSNTAAGESSVAIAGSETISHFSCWSLSTLGVFYFSGDVVTPQPIAEDGKLTYATGVLKVSITGAA